MSKRDYIWKKAERWQKDWRRHNFEPGAQMAYVAGWQACERDRQKRTAVGKNASEVAK